MKESRTALFRKARRATVVLFLLLVSVIVSPMSRVSAANTEEKSCQKILWHRLKPREGDMVLQDAGAKIRLPKDWRFILGTDSATETDYNFLMPECAEEGITGYVLENGDPAQKLKWSAEVRYHNVGYVSIEDVISADYEWMMRDMQQVYRRWNVERKYRGEHAIEIAGWNIRPSYLPPNESMMWSIARFDSPVATAWGKATLIKLGRRGYIEINIYTTGNRIGEARQIAVKLAEATVFDSDMRYTKFDPAVDRRSGLTVGSIVSNDMRVDYPEKIGSVGHWMQGVEHVFKKAM